MPKSTTRTPSGNARRSSARATSEPKASSPRKMLPMPAIRMRGCVMPVSTFVRERQRLDLFGGEEEAVAGLAHHSQIPTRVVFQNDREMNLVLVGLLD